MSCTQDGAVGLASYLLRTKDFVFRSSRLIDLTSIVRYQPVAVELQNLVDDDRCDQNFSVRVVTIVSSATL